MQTNVISFGDNLNQLLLLQRNENLVVKDGKIIRQIKPLNFQESMKNFESIVPLTHSILKVLDSKDPISLSSVNQNYIQNFIIQIAFNITYLYFDLMKESNIIKSYNYKYNNDKIMNIYYSIHMSFDFKISLIFNGTHNKIYNELSPLDKMLLSDGS